MEKFRGNSAFGSDFRENQGAQENRLIVRTEFDVNFLQKKKKLRGKYFLHTFRAKMSTVKLHVQCQIHAKIATFLQFISQNYMQRFALASTLSTIIKYCK